MPRKKLIADPEIAARVRKAAAVLTPQNDIIKANGISREVFERLYRDVWEQGRIEASEAVGAKLFNHIMSPNPFVSLRAISMYRAQQMNDRSVRLLDNNNENSMSTDMILSQQIERLNPTELRAYIHLCRKMGGTLPGDGGGPPLIDGYVEPDDE